MADTTRCPDGHQCLNGSLCVEVDGDEGAYYCDCDIAFNKKGSAFEGFKCEHEATVYCTDDKSASKSHFCTNGGKCKAEASSNKAHVGCKCDDNYEGEHCQFVKGTRPDGWPFNKEVQSSDKASTQPNSSGGGVGGGAIAGIVIGLLVGVIAVAFLVKKFTKKRSDIETTEGKTVPERAVHDIDPDGGVLQTAMSDQTSEGTQSDGNEFVDGMKNEDVAEAGEEGEII